MRGNTIGQLFRLTTFGESHGVAIGGVVDGCPAGLEVDLEAIQQELDRRRPGSTPLGTARNEADRVEFLSGLAAIPGQARHDKSVTLGTPIAFLIRNSDARSGDYDHLKDVYRPGHADRTWEQKFGLRDHRGGGRSSARTTAACVAGGALARQLLAPRGVVVNAYVDSVGELVSGRDYRTMDLASVWDDPVRAADTALRGEMQQLIEHVRSEGDSIGGSITLVARGVPAGLGEPVFDKLHADLGKALLGINAAKGFEIGEPNASGLRGSAYNDALTGTNGAVRAATNHSGGIQGGISNGEDIICRVSFRPVSTIAKAQNTMDRHGNAVTLEAQGRHDPCVVPRAVPIVEAMACLVLADHLLRNASARATFTSP
jgi:chorismate synthase